MPCRTPMILSQSSSFLKGPMAHQRWTSLVTPTRSLLISGGIGNMPVQSVVNSLVGVTKAVHRW